MSDRRPSNPHMKDRVLTTSRWNQTFDEWEDTEAADLAKVLAYDPVAAITAVRRGVESGTIKGEVVESRFNAHRGEIVEVFRSGIYIVVGPVSDGGSET